MPASVLDETRLTLSQAAKLIFGPTGEPVVRQTVRRLIVEGVRVKGVRVKLDGQRSSKTWITSREAVERFNAACNPEANATPEPARTPAASTRASKRAERELIRRGV